MWWRGEDDDALVAALSRLDGLEDPYWLYGYGVAFDRGRRVPLLIVDQWLDPRPRLWAPGDGVLDRVLRRWLQRVDVPAPPWLLDEGFDLDDYPEFRGRRVSATKMIGWTLRATLLPFRRSTSPSERGELVPVGSAGPEVRGLASQAELPTTTLISYWPKPRFVGRRLSGKNRRRFGSTGFRMSFAPDLDLLVTAGHLALGANARAFLSDRFGWQRRRMIGRVTVEHNPRSSPPPIEPTIDVALIALSDPTHHDVPVGRVVPEDVDDEDLCEWTGAASGRRRGDIVGGLSTLRVEGIRLARCWYLGGGCRSGDSGAAVVHLGQMGALGHVVGSRGVVLGRFGRTGTVVQDMSIVDDVIGPMPVEARIFVRRGR